MVRAISLLRLINVHLITKYQQRTYWSWMRQVRLQCFCVERLVQDERQRNLVSKQQLCSERNRVYTHGEANLIFKNSNVKILGELQNLLREHEWVFSVYNGKVWGNFWETLTSSPIFITLYWFGEKWEDIFSWPHYTV